MWNLQFAEPIEYETRTGEPATSDFSFCEQPGFDVSDEDWYRNLKLNNVRRRFPNSPGVTQYRNSTSYRSPCFVRNSRGLVYKVK